ncbi:hypothetical protein GGX14DRAFT_403428 [Mycena pura]|uniref:Uncharacterized protein n=1 Tax=Mycena pura TaxID=153505 RepID=A0AAD6UXX1_9AGAR|nr:hypothetical protein GGX14DRAFT_403428 [Mycena pura]
MPAALPSIPFFTLLIIFPCFLAPARRAVTSPALALRARIRAGRLVLLRSSSVLLFLVVMSRRVAALSSRHSWPWARAFSRPSDLTDVRCRVTRFCTPDESNCVPGWTKRDVHTGLGSAQEARHAASDATHRIGKRETPPQTRHTQSHPRHSVAHFLNWDVTD